MPLGTNPDFVAVKNFFAGSNSFADYYRGGPYVPNIAANAGISATANGLALTQFSGADKVTLPPAPTLQDAYSGDNVQSNGGWMQAYASVELRTNGYVYAHSDNSSSGNVYQWLPAGRSASEYQYRTSVNGGSTWSAWATISSNITVSSASATTDGFYSDQASHSILIQLGAQGTALTGTATFSTDATAYGRG